MTEYYNSEDHDEAPARPLLPALFAGLRCRCPNCHNGRMFSSFLKTPERCEACGEELHHHRADDLPAYLVIFIVGHLSVGAYMLVDRMFTLEWWQHLMIWLPAVAILSFALLPFAKGATIGLQWALRMHGFDGRGADMPMAR